jgi:hypothetical protein
MPRKKQRVKEGAVISQKIELFITTAVRNSNLTISKMCLPSNCADQRILV